MKASEIRNLTDQELALKERVLREDVYKTRFKKHTGELANTAHLKAARQDLARVLTEQRSRELARQAGAQS